MITRTARLTGFAAALTVSAAALTGCGAAAEPSADSAATVSVATPRDSLLKAVPDAAAGAHHFVIKGGTQPVTGVVDPANKVATLEVSQAEPEAGFTLTMKFLVVQEQAWTKINFKPSNLAGLPKVPKKWLLIDLNKIKNKDDSPLTYDGETDLGSTADVFHSSADVKEVSPGHFAGTTDLTQQTEAGIVDEATLKALGEQAKAVPFQAVVDDQGHLTSTVLKIPAAGKAKATTYSVTYDGFGTTKTPAVPAEDEQQKATTAVYDMLNA
ncbi:hypothetical protein ACWKSP_09135 [Micromonosporaceae bacterium Da 78-11]